VSDPGTFEWKDGVLVQAMTEGKFLVLENIDKASSEVLGTLWPLVESLSMLKPIGAHAHLNVSGRKKVVAKEGFALFATRTIRSTENGTLPPPTFLGSHKWKRVDLRSYSDDEMALILCNKYQRLNDSLIKAIIGVWNGLIDLEKQLPNVAARPINTGDLMKWAARVKTLLHNRSGAVVDAMEVDSSSIPPMASLIQNPVIREELFSEARDIFFGSVNPNSEATKARVELGLRLLADSLSLSVDRIKWLTETRTAEIEFRKGRDGGITQVSLDHITLNAMQAPVLPNTPLITSQFALHRPSLNLLASLAACIQANEPVLLTGETGTGKTTVVTYLATLLSQPLVSLNLSHQTESSDLIGGYKPLEARMPAQALQEKFISLFSNTFSRERNAKFEEAIRIAVSSGKWKRAVALWKEAAGRADERIRVKENMEKNKG
jgi:midasin